MRERHKIRQNETDNRPNQHTQYIVRGHTTGIIKNKNLEYAFIITNNHSDNIDVNSADVLFLFLHKNKLLFFILDS